MRRLNPKQETYYCSVKNDRKVLKKATEMARFALGAFKKFNKYSETI